MLRCSESKRFVGERGRFMAKKASKIKLKSGANIGSPAAETDHTYLKDCFVDLPGIEALKDVNSPRSLLLGRTGAGKSAILWHLESELEQVSRVDPKVVSFEYIGNSSIVRHVSEIGVDLHVVYQYLWKSRVSALIGCHP